MHHDLVDDIVDDIAVLDLNDDSVSALTLLMIAFALDLVYDRICFDLGWHSPSTFTSATDYIL